MGWYTELFCDNENCPSGANNEGPQGPNRRVVAAEARRAGWTKGPRGWLCRQCTVDQTKEGEG